VSDDSDRLIEKIDPMRTALLGIWTTILAIAFLAFLVADQASAALFL
jgi:hypothetical protein